MNDEMRTLGYLQQDVESIGVLIGWESGHLSEGQAMALLKTDRVTARMFKQWALANEVILDRSAERDGSAEQPPRAQGDEPGGAR